MDSRGRQLSRLGRSAFTLVELLVVLTIIAIVSAIALQTVVSIWGNRGLSAAARTVQGALVGARDDAIHSNAPSGIRLLPDPTSVVTLPNGQLDPSAPLVASRIVPIAPAPNYSEGLISIYPPSSYANAIRTVNGAAGVPCLVVEESVGQWVQQAGVYTFQPNAPTSWMWNIRLGDQIQINNTGPWYTVVGPATVNQAQGNSELFINVGKPGTALPSRILTAPDGVTTKTVNPEYLLLVNGRDDNVNGLVDEGFNGLDDNANGLTDEAAEWEIEVWLGAIGDKVGP